MCDLALFATTIRTYVLLVLSVVRRNYQEQKDKKAPYLLNKTPTTNWFLLYIIGGREAIPT